MSLLVWAAFAALSCGKYGPPVRAEQKPAPVESERQSGDEATP